ncbi:putative fibroblast growth factor 1 [Osmerus eperlanus]|uniref:putative fibroblast growth factor 1 n=1 Tax=Osmerus eperlanus TaxID=29151 RepID=UPI002E14AFCC
MTEGDISVLSLGPSTLDLSQQDYRPVTRLYSMNGGHHLRILPDGTVTGSRQENDIHAILRVKAVSAGLVVIKGLKAALYLTMDKDGHVFASPTLKDECYFQETMEENHYNTYMSQKYSNWYLALKKNGQPKAGPTTHLGQKAVYFLPRPVDDSTAM